MHAGMPMHDRQVVASIVDGNIDGLATAFDEYAPGLFAYCQAQLTESAGAADAVQDTFIIAAAKVAALSQPERLRPWLFAVARSECQRRLQVAGPSAPLYEASEAMDDTGTFTAVTEQAELRAQVRSALAELDPAEREVVELSLRHRLYGSDLADVLGVPRGQAQALAAAARTQFERALGLPLVARFERDNCPDLAAILDAGGRRVVLGWRVRRHIKHCELCGEREHRDFGAAVMLAMLTPPPLPAGLNRRTVSLAASASPDAVIHRGEVLDRAAPLGDGGFPRQLTTPSALRWRGTPVLAAAVATSAVALLGGGMYYVALAAIHTVSPPSPAAHGTPAPGPTGSGRSGKALARSPSRAAPLRQPIFLPAASGSTVPSPLLPPTVTVPTKRPASAKHTTRPSTGSGNPSPGRTGPGRHPATTPPSTAPPTTPPTTTPPTTTPPTTTPPTTTPPTTEPATTTPPAGGRSTVGTVVSAVLGLL